MPQRKKIVYSWTKHRQGQARGNIRKQRKKKQQGKNRRKNQKKNPTTSGKGK